MDNTKLQESLDTMSKWQIEHAIEDREAHEEDLNARKEFSARLDTVESNLSLLPDEHTIEKIIRKVLLEVLYSTGRGSKFWLITTASVIGALLVIFGGLKTMLAWIGFSYIK